MSFGSADIVNQNPFRFAFDTYPSLINYTINIQSIQRHHTDSTLQHSTLAALLAHIKGSVEHETVLIDHVAYEVGRNTRCACG
jgi:hypothetical protein